MITLGCDPEFVMFNPSNHTLIETDPVLKCLDRKDPISQEIGQENSYVFELRPMHSTSPRNLVERIRFLLHAIAKYSPQSMKYEWMAGSNVQGFSIGGHIHFGCKCSECVIGVLNSVFSPVMALIEDETERENRLSNTYGFFDYRKESHGFEYRTPASWLWSPGIALGTLALAQAIANDGSKGKLPWKAIQRLKGLSYYMIFPDSSKCIDRSKARRSFNDIWKVIQKIPSVRRFYPEISFLRELILRERRWNNDADMKMRWGIICT